MVTRREIERERDKLSSFYLNLSLRVRGGEKRGKRAENETDIWIDSKMGKYCIEKNDKRKQK